MQVLGEARQVLELAARLGSRHAALIAEAESGLLLERLKTTRLQRAHAQLYGQVGDVLP